MNWRVVDAGQGLRFEDSGVMGSEQVTLAEIRLPAASRAKIHVIYFPSRFDTPADHANEESLTTFAHRTPETTRVDFWDTSDSNIGTAMRAFGVERVPAVVLSTGFEVRPDGSLDTTTSYRITFAEPSVLEDQARFQEALGAAYDLMERGEAWAIADLIRKRKRQELLDKLSAAGREIRDALIALHPKFSVGPGGVSLELGR